MLGKDFRPYPKSEQLKSHQKMKDTPKFKEKRPKKKKKSYVHRGRVIPPRKERTKITQKNYQAMIKEFGDYCLKCGYTPIEAHHIVFRSAFGSGNWRNLAPLCMKCHQRAHKDRAFADELRQERAAMYGEYFWADKYTLFKEGIIPNTTDEAYKRYMKSEVERIEKVRASENS
jgi:5-methylcytosine-specific restriction endonuclease McrA